MIKKSIFPILAFLFVFALATTADEGRLLRYPDYENGTIVFVYQNDLWTVPESGGVARRITVFNGNEDHPKFSPDGKWLFVGNLNHQDVSVLKVDGKRVSDTRKNIPLPGRPGAMRGRAR